MLKPPYTRALRVFRKGRLVRPRDLPAAGVPAWVLYELVKRGEVEQVSRGLYTLPGHSPTENHSYAEAVKRVPNGILCLLSALRFHELTVQNPPEVWLALPRSAWKPKFSGLHLRIVRFSGAALTEGVETHLVEGVSVRVTSVARTIADCFRYRNKLGREVALEALHEGWRKKRFTMDELWRFAELDRVTKVIMPYLETIPS